MHIKIYNGNSFYIIFLLHIPGPDRHVVEITKAHGLINLRMMPGRTDCTKGIVYFTFHHHIDGFKYSTDSQKGNIISIPANCVIRMFEFGKTGNAGLIKTHDIVNIMDRFYPSLIGFVCLYQE